MSKQWKRDIEASVVRLSGRCDRLADIINVNTDVYRDKLIEAGKDFKQTARTVDAHQQELISMRARMLDLEKKYDTLANSALDKIGMFAEALAAINIGTQTGDFQPARDAMNELNRSLGFKQDIEYGVDDAEDEDVGEEDSLETILDFGGDLAYSGTFEGTPWFTARVQAPEFTNAGIRLDHLFIEHRGDNVVTSEQIGQIVTSPQQDYIAYMQGETMATLVTDSFEHAAYALIRRRLHGPKD